MKSLKKDQPTLELPRKCHFIGIGGIGMSALARLLLKENVTVSGSDISTGYMIESLVKGGAKVYSQHKKENIAKDMTIIYSSDIPKDNPEYQQAIKLNCPMMHRSDLLQRFMATKKSLAVAGTHGKTTTTALLTAVLKEANLKPSFMVGGIVRAWGLNAEAGDGEHFIAEADESDGTFLKYFPYGAIVTNIDLDHLNHFGTEDHLEESFKKFMGQVQSPEHLYWCGDDERLLKLSPPGISYGFSSGCQVRAQNFKQRGWKCIFDAVINGKQYRGIEVALTGRHNALNSLAVFAMALGLGIEEESIRMALKTFSGTGRRCETKGEESGILFIDDYAHHPTEIAVTLKAIRAAVKERRIVVVYQPHRYSRMKYCLGQFNNVFQEADELFITEIYSANEEPVVGVTSEVLLAEVKRGTLIKRSDVAKKIAPLLQRHDVVVTLGAGDVTKASAEIIEYLRKRPAKKLRIGVICGGANCEYEVSLRSAEHVKASLKKETYEVDLFEIGKTGQWAGPPSAIKQGLIPHAIMDRLNSCDVLFPVLHGPYGEDGTIQGMFEMLKKPYVGVDSRSAAVCMDKAWTKKLAEVCGVPIAPFVDFDRSEWINNSEEILEKIAQKLTYPVFVKAVHLGSSVGVHKVEKAEALIEAIESVFEVDFKVIIENGIQGRELEFAVLGNDELTVFPPGEVLTGGRVYDYDAKYGPQGIDTTLEPVLSSDLIEQGKKWASMAYRAVGANGMARIDFFLDTKGRYWLNEINPIPGFTSISLYPKICEKHGLISEELMDWLVILALHKYRRSKVLK